MTRTVSSKKILDGLDSNRICKSAIEFFGDQAQIRKAIEEMAELTVSLCHSSVRSGLQAAVIEEIADVQIMLFQLMILFGEKTVESMLTFKLMRLEKRLEEAKAERKKQNEAEKSEAP